MHEDMDDSNYVREGVFINEKLKQRIQCITMIENCCFSGYMIYNLKKKSCITACVKITPFEGEGVNKVLENIKMELSVT